MGCCLAAAWRPLVETRGEKIERYSDCFGHRKIEASFKSVVEQALKTVLIFMLLESTSRQQSRNRSQAASRPALPSACMPPPIDDRAVLAALNCRDALLRTPVLKVGWTLITDVPMSFRHDVH